MFFIFGFNATMKLKNNNKNNRFFKQNIVYNIYDIISNPIYFKTYNCLHIFKGSSHLGVLETEKLKNSWYIHM